MSKWFKFFNLFSQSPGLRINGERKPATIFGSIVGFFTISILLSAITYILFNYFSLLDYKINSYTDNLAEPNIDIKNLQLDFFIMDSLGNEIQEPERIFEISAKFWEMYVDNLAENKTQRLEITDIPKIKCNHESANQQLRNKYKNSTCFDLSKMNKNLTGPFKNLVE